MLSKLRPRRAGHGTVVGCGSFALVLSLVIGGPVPSADAAFPGRNGRIAYEHVLTTGPPWNVPTQSEIVSVRPNGTRRRTPVGFARGGNFAAPAYSPDGRKLAMSNGVHAVGSSLYLVRANGRGRLRRLTRARAGEQWDNAPDWSADGRRLVYARSDYYSGYVRVYRAGRNRTIARLDALLHPAWSARGQIAFSAIPNTRCGPSGCSPSGPSDPVIYVARPDGSHRRRVAAGSEPDWSPSGRWIVYQRPDRSYEPAGGIAMIRPDGRRRRVLTDTGIEPAFSPDGRYIVFVGGREVGDRLVVVRLRDRRMRTIVKAPPAVETPTLFQTHEVRSPDWQPLPPRSSRRSNDSRADVRK